MRERRSNPGGFTLFAVLLAIALLGIGAQVAVEPWKTVVKRERETELFYRGAAIQRAIGLYYRNSPGGRFEYPAELKDLLLDPRYPGQPRRYLRRVYRDPMSEDGEWSLIADARERIKGVRSPSNAAPLKTDGFPDAFRDFAGKQKYSEWVFEFKPEPTPVSKATPQPSPGASPRPTSSPTPTPILP